MININKFEHYSEGDYILCMTSSYCYRSFTNITLLFDHFQCHCTNGRQHFSFLKKPGP